MFQTFGIITIDTKEKAWGKRNQKLNFHMASLVNRCGTEAIFII